ncbi:TolC family protein [Spirosoma areae]
MHTYLTLAGLLLSSLAGAQDSLRLTIRQADSLFVKSNLLLLAERYRINASQAQVIQAGLFDNPTVTLEVSAYNTQARRVLDVGRQGQKFVAVQQLLSTAGKRAKRVALAQEAARLTEFEFRDLLRALRFDLHTRLYTVYFQSNTLQQYDQQIATLQTTVDAFEVQYTRNNVSLRELLRLRALLFGLTNDRTEIRLGLADQQQALRILLQTDQPVRSVIGEADLVRYRLPARPLDTLQAIAFRSRADLKASESLTRQAELNYTLQKALAKPDVRVGGSYDQAASYVPNYIGLSVSMDVPLLNRNQGGIRAAGSQIDYQRLLQRQKGVQVATEIAIAWQKIREIEQLYQTVSSQFIEQFELLNRGVVDNFQKRNISLLEFIDIVETYNNSIRELNRLRADRVSAYEELNYTVGEDILN